MEELFQNLGINGKLLFAQVINFLILFWILHKVVFKRLFAFLEARRSRIEKGLALTARAEQEMQRINEARSLEIAKAKKKGEEILAETKAAAQNQARNAAALARAEAEKIILRAKGDAQTAKQDALLGAREEMRLSALFVAQKILSRNLTRKDEDRLAKEALEEVGKIYAK
ncbi:MAG: F0F1 ATP synthase subunit B [Candidatus Wildermuthbacteria bacterium]|nr:F0F1 ATP synthase subunit B [Candidatus Wildermuthbacteria bacterium]